MYPLPSARFRATLRVIIGIVVVLGGLALVLARQPGRSYYLDTRCWAGPGSIDPGAPAHWILTRTQPVAVGLAEMIVPILVGAVIAWRRPRIWTAALWPLASVTWMLVHLPRAQVGAAAAAAVPCTTRVVEGWAVDAFGTVLGAIILALLASLTLAVMTPVQRVTVPMRAVSPPEIPPAVARRR